MFVFFKLQNVLHYKTCNYITWGLFIKQKLYNGVNKNYLHKNSRKDLISAMKLPDSEPLTPSEYWVITDTWKQDWERGVQVPVNPDSLPAPKVEIIHNPTPPNFQEFKL